jgi:hypothetical protein
MMDLTGDETGSRYVAGGVAVFDADQSGPLLGASIDTAG